MFSQIRYFTLKKQKQTNKQPLFKNQQKKKTTTEN